MVNPEIRKEYVDLIESIEVLLGDVKDKRESSLTQFESIREIQSQFSEQYPNPKDLPIDEIRQVISNNKKLKSISRSMELEHNSKFIYAFALFERFQSKVIDAICQDENESYKEKYKSKFLAKAKEELTNLNNHELINSVHDFEKTLDYKTKVDNLLKLCRDLLEIKGIKSFDEDLVFYQEARERRNLLVHRGTKKDDKYTKSIFEHTKRKKDLTEKIMEYIEGNLDFQSDSKNVSSRYFNNVLSIIYYFSSVIYFHTFKLTDEEIAKNHEIFPDFQHNLLKLSVHNPRLGTYINKVWLAYFQTRANKSFKNFPDYEKINLCLLLNFGLESDDKKMTNITKDILNSISSEKQLEKELITAIISKEHDSILSTLKEFLLKTNKSKEDIDSWFMMHELLKDEVFKAKFNELNIN